MSNFTYGVTVGIIGAFLWCLLAGVMAYAICKIAEWCSNK